MKKIQVPVIGGIRKVIRTTPSNQVGTTIAEYGSGTITLAQLKTALGINTVVAGPNTQSKNPPASIAPGQGLGGGGPVVGNVPIYLTAPIPYGIFDEGGGGGDGDSGPPGLQGTNGVTGPPGPVAGWFVEDGVEGMDASIPGNTGPQGATGVHGPIGPAAFLAADDGEDGWHAIPGAGGAPGVQGPPGPLYFAEEPEGEPLIAVVPNPFRRVNKGANWYSNAGAIQPAQTNVVYVYCPVPATIRASRIIGTPNTGNAVVDVWASTVFPPTVANSITASDKPTLTGANYSLDTTLTGWTRYIPAGTWLAFALTLSTVFQQVECVLEIEQ
jgi:hypothetical protein